MANKEQNQDLIAAYYYGYIEEHSKNCKDSDCELCLLKDAAKRTLEFQPLQNVMEFSVRHFGSIKEAQRAGVRLCRKFKVSAFRVEQVQSGLWRGWYIIIPIIGEKK